MIEQAIINALAADTTLAGYVSTYRGSPAIFSEESPEDCAEPYITLRIQRDAADSVIHQFAVYVDFWDHGKSRASSRAAAERIEFVLDNKKLSSDRYSNIRLWFFSGGPVEDDADPQLIHYNVQFEGRATRSKWMQQLTN